MSSPRHSHAIGVLTVVLTLAGWSAVPLFLKHFASLIDPWTSNGWRYGFAALLWLPVIVFGVYRKSLPSRLWALALVPALLNCVGQMCFTWAHYKIDPGLLTFGLRSQLIAVAVGAYFLFPTERRIITSAPYLVGLVIVTVGTAGTIVTGERLQIDGVFGVVLALAAGVFFASYGLSVRYFMAGINSVIAFSAISLYTAIGMIAVMLMIGDQLGATALQMPSGQFGLLLLSSVIGIALGHVFYYISIARLGVAVSAGVIQLQPFCVALCSMVLFGEFLNLAQWISGVLAIMGAIIMLETQRRMGRKNRAQQADESLAVMERDDMTSEPVGES